MSQSRFGLCSKCKAFHSDDFCPLDILYIFDPYIINFDTYGWPWFDITIMSKLKVIARDKGITVEELIKEFVKNGIKENE